jgi:hypothetical protein
MLWVLLACSLIGSQDADIPPDLSVDEALALCTQRDGTDKIGKCKVDALKARNALSLSACTAIQGRWRGRCVLQASAATHGPLDNRYQTCAQRGGDARNCRLRLWQADVLALEPGHPDHALQLDGMRELVKRHRHHISDVHPGIDDEMWTRFWAAWWEQQAQASADGHAPIGCDAFTTPTDGALCTQWQTPAQAWLQARRPSAQQIRAPAGAPGGSQATPP